MNRQPEILGVHAFIFRSGTNFTIPNPGGVAGRAAKPGPTDPVWYDLGIVDVSIASSATKTEIWKAAPGIKQLHDILRSKRKIEYKIKRTELDNLQIEAIWGAGALPLTGAPGQFNPLEQGAEGIQAWLKLQYYGRAGTNLITVDHFVDLDNDGDWSPGDDPVESGILATGLFSTLNSGTLA